MADFKHSDCHNYENVDVFKGICIRTNGYVPFDGKICPKFVKKPKCKFCKSFVNPDEENIGSCTGLSEKPYWTNGERIATTCEGYEEK